MDVVIEKKAERLEGNDALFVQENWDCGLFTMIFHFPDHQCDDLEKYCSIQFLDGTCYENFSVVLRRAYLRNSIRRGTRIQETASALKSIVERLEMKGKTELEQMSLS